MKNICFLAPIILSISLTGCANASEHSSYHSVLKDLNTNTFSTSLSNAWSRTQKEVSRKTPKQVKDTLTDLENNAHDTYGKAIIGLSKAKKYTTNVLDDNYNAIFD